MLRTFTQGTTMKKILFTLLCLTLLGLVTTPVWADQCGGALPLGSATGCGVVITATAVNASGQATAFTLTNTGNGNPYDGMEDTLIGIVNNSGGVLKSITLSSPNTAFGGLYNFDGDGVCGFQSPGADCFNGALPGSYQGPNNTFTGINGSLTSGTVSFSTGIPNGGSTWFALEGTPQSIIPTTVPEPASILLLGSGLVGVAFRRLRKR